MPEQPLGGAEAVALRGVEEVDAELERAADRLGGLALLRGAPVAAELPRAEADARHAHVGVAERGVVHQAPAPEACCCTSITRRSCVPTPMVRSPSRTSTSKRSLRPSTTSRSVAAAMQ